MKKIKTMVAFLVVVVIMLSKTSVVQAAENKLTVVKVGDMTVEELSEEEMAAMPTELNQIVIGGEQGQIQATNTSYTAYRYSQTFEFYEDNALIATADAACVVWHYTDGKVHLYSRTISVGSIPTYGANKSYGSIVNTDGSYSYTTGDRVRVFNALYTWTYAIDFYASANEQYFSCYEI